jgi:hypothetical protein
MEETTPEQRDEIESDPNRAPHEGGTHASQAPDSEGSDAERGRGEGRDSGS